MTMMERIRAADSMPTPSGGPLNRGIAFIHSGVATWNCLTNGTSTKMPHSP